MKVEVILNDAKRGVELLFSEELPKGLANRLKEVGFKQGFKEPLKWYAPQHPAFINYAKELKEALLKDEAFLSIHIQPSFDPSEENIDHNKFSYVTISFNKDKNKEQDSYVLFDSYKTIATAISKRFGKNKYGVAFLDVDVSPRNYKRKARKLLQEGKVIADNTPKEPKDDDFEIIEKSQEVSPLYHGTCIPFKRFEKQFIGTVTGDIPSQFGYHFTPSKELSEQLFANEPYKDSYEDCRVYNVGIKVKKTLRTTESTLVKKVLRWGVEQNIITERPEELLKVLQLPYYDPKGSSQATIFNTLNSEKWENKGKRIINYEILTIRYLNEVLRPMGIDSIHYMNEIEWSNEQRYDWIVFDVSQIIYKEVIPKVKAENKEETKKPEKRYSVISEWGNDYIYKYLADFSGDVIYQLAELSNLTVSQIQVKVTDRPRAVKLIRKKFDTNKNLTPVDARDLAREILVKGILVANPQEKLTNEHGVYTKETAGNNYEKIEIPIPATAKYKASVSIVKDEEGLYRMTTSTAKQFGDASGSSSPVSNNSKQYKTKEDALEVAINLIYIRIQDQIQKHDSILNNDFRKDKMLQTALESVEQFAIDNNLEPEFLVDKEVKTKKEPQEKISKKDAKAIAVDITSRDKEVPNVLVPKASKEPFISGSIYIQDAQKVQDASPNLLQITDDNLPKTTAVELFELSQMPHPNEYGINVSRSALLKEWQKRGETAFQELGFPTDMDYPYVNTNTGYNSVYPLSRVLGDDGNKWWSVVENHRPIAKMNKAIDYIQQRIASLKDALSETINPKTNKPKAAEKEHYRKITWDIEQLSFGKEQIEDYLKANPNKSEPQGETTKPNKSESKGIRSRLSLEEFIEYGTIGFDKLSAYKPNVVRIAKQVMEEAIELGYAIPYDYGKGKGKYTSTEKADKMSFRDIFTNAYNNIHINKLLPESREGNEEVKNKSLFTSDKDIPKQKMKDCEGENQAGDATMFSCVNVMVLGKGYQGWNYTPFLGLQIILKQINAPIAEFVQQLETETNDDWSWLNGDLGAEIDLYTKKPRKESYYISTSATISDLLDDLIAANFSEVHDVFKGYLAEFDVKSTDVISELKPKAKEKSSKSSDYQDKVIAYMHDKYAKGERPTKGQIKKIAEEIGVQNMGMMWEATELSWLLWYKMMYRDTSSFENRLLAMIDFWDKGQPTYAYSDSSKEIYKQYSTPCPIGAIIAQYTGMDEADAIFEPSAGNGLLLVGADPQKVHVNEIDTTRTKSLTFQGFKKITHFNAAQPFPEEMAKKFDVVVTNPPFARWEEEKFSKDHIVRKYFSNHRGLSQHIRLEHLMSGLALHTMKDKGKAAIIIMGHLYFGDDGLLAKYRPFFNWLYRNYQVDDVINMNSFKLYNKQGAVEKTMLILIGGRKSEPENVAPTQEEAPHLYDMVDSFFELWLRVKSHIKYDIDVVIQQLNIELTGKLIVPQKEKSTDNMECYIDFLDSKNNFKKTRKDFKNYDSALAWMKQNFEKWDLDMINYY